MAQESRDWMNRIDAELAIINILMLVTNDDDLKNILLMRVDILDNELSMIAETEENQSFYDRRVIDSIVGEETSDHDG
jgi:hypothetical protein